MAVKNTVSHSHAVAVKITGPRPRKEEKKEKRRNEKETKKEEDRYDPKHIKFIVNKINFLTKQMYKITAPSGD